MSQLTFSGHDTFHCRQFWLKKAFDYVQVGGNFNDLNAPLDLGVGKNMVTAIRYWARCFGILDGDIPTPFAVKLLGKKGWDPYLEDHGSLWLLHHRLVTLGKADIYSIIFNELIRERPEFGIENFVSFINLRKEGEYNENTLRKDFTVFYRTYFADFKSGDLEESFTGIMSEIDLLKKVKKQYLDADGKLKPREVWVIERDVRKELPLHILLYAIVSAHPTDLSIGFEQLYGEFNSVGSVFCLSKEGLTIALQRMADIKEYDITFSNEAGIRELQFKKQLNSEKILEDYYGR
jgi:hypothetical protein